MKLLYLILFLSLPSSLAAQDVPVIKVDGLEAILKSDKHEIQVINFWATWCGPCVKELPLFEALHAKQEPDINVVLVNLDFADQIGKVKKFMSRRNIQSPVVLLDDLDYNSWIDKVDKSWSGAIPATLVINSKTGKRKFVDKELHEGDLDRIIEELKKS